MPAIHRKDASLPLHALLSQTLVAYTIEFDNEFQRQMSETGYTGAGLSFVAWANLIRFIADSGVSVRELAVQALSLDERIKHQLGCLERWRFVVLQSASKADQSARAARAIKRVRASVTVGAAAGEFARSGSFV